MAKEDVQAFFAEVAKNADLQKQLAAATEKANAGVQKAIEAHIANIVDFAKKAGFDFTAEELLATSQQGDKKLDVNELDAVAGGVSTSGGGLCMFLGYGLGAVAGGAKSSGGGLMACWGLGIGGGSWT